MYYGLEGEALAEAKVFHEAWAYMLEQLEAGTSVRVIAKNMDGVSCWRAWVLAILDQWAVQDLELAPHRKDMRRRTLEALQASAQASGDLKHALRAVELLCKLDGLFEPEKVVVQGSGLEDEERLKALLKNPAVRAKFKELVGD